ncbi:MAG: three-Cys-motif partner protein TcmP [Vicinamibacterales bacterium]
MAEPPDSVRLDEIGYWSEVKLDIIRDYATEYSKILSKQNRIQHLYIDAFAGAGTHLSKETGLEVAGSPLIAAQVEPPFSELHLVDLDGGRAARLRDLSSGDPRVTVYEGDGNEVLLRHVFPRCRYDQYRRGLCLLDPYGLNVRWEVLRQAGQMKSIEVFFNFMISDANRNVLWKEPARVDPVQAARMDLVWGDSSWRQSAYRTDQDLLGDVTKKEGNDAIAEAFRKRLRNVAGFAYVPQPIPMRNRRGAIVYYLFFAAQKPVANKIVTHIFDKYRNRGAA